MQAAVSQRCEAVMAHANKRKAFRGAVSVFDAACPHEPVASGIAASSAGAGGSLAFQEQILPKKKRREMHAAKADAVIL